MQAAITVSNSGSADGTYLPTFSGHGDLLALWRVNADGTLTLANSVTYTTWGRPTIAGANGYADLGFRRLYLGRSDVWTDDTYGAGLLYMHARTYVPALGRFLQPDPAEAEGNLYGYAANSPITKADACGTFAGYVGLGPMCQRRYDEILQKAQQLARRVYEEENGLVSASPGHLKAIRQVRESLEQLIRSYNRSKCPDAYRELPPSAYRHTTLNPRQKVTSHAPWLRGIPPYWLVGGGAAATGAWWLFKVLSPACGPAFGLCLVAL